MDLNFTRILLSFGFVIGAVWLAKYVTREAERWSARKVRYRHTLMNVASVARFVIYIAAAVLVATTLFNFSREALLAAGGAIALTASFAFQDLAMSFVGGLTLLIDRPFQVGDRVQFKEHYGDITAIGLRAVRLQTLDDNTVSIPNNQFMKEAVASANAGALDMMVVFDFYLDPNSPVEAACQIVEQAVVTSKYVYLAKPVSVLVFEKIIGQVFCMHISAKAYVFNTRYEKAMVSDITRRVKRSFRERGILAPRHPLVALPYEAPASSHPALPPAEGS